MKIRTGFVSNSSSSSFCIYGTYINGELKEQIEKNLIKMGYSEQDLVNGLEDFFGYNNERKELGLEFHSVIDESSYLGNSWSSVKDNETGKQFKERTEKAIEKIVGRQEKYDTYSEAWYNG